MRPPDSTSQRPLLGLILVACGLPLLPQWEPLHDLAWLFWMVSLALILIALAIVLRSLRPDGARHQAQRAEEPGKAEDPDDRPLRATDTDD